MDKKSVQLVLAPKGEVMDAVLENCILQHGGAFSVAYADAPDGIPYVDTISFPLKDSKHTAGALGEVKETLEALADYKRVICFSSDDTDIQPFTLIVSEKDQPQLVAFLDGDFKEKGRDTEGHSDEYAEANDYLTSKVLALFEDKADSDIAKLCTLLKGPNVAKELGKTGNGDHMTMIMLASNGDVLCFGRPPGEHLVKYDWGHMSHDITPPVEPKKEEPKKEEPPKVEPEKPMTAAEKLKARRAAAATSPPAPTGQGTTTATPSRLNDLKDRLKAKAAEAAGAPGKVKDEGKTEVVRVDGDLRVVRVPANIATHNLRGFLTKRIRGGDLSGTMDLAQKKVIPWEQMSGRDMLVPMDLLVQAYPKKSAKALLDEFPSASTSIYAQQAALQTNPTTTSVPGISEKKDPKLATAVPSEDQPVDVPAAHLQNLESKFMRKPRITAFRSKKYDSIMDPALTKHVEQKLPEFWELLRLENIETTYEFGEKDFHEMGSLSLNLLARAASNYKNRLIKAEQELFTLKGGTVKETNLAQPMTAAEKLKARRANAKAA